MLIRECVEKAVDVVAQKALSKGIDIAARVTQRTPLTVRCDPTRVRQILFNLLSNGRTHCSKHARLCSLLGG